jgi:hypothetical protein
MPAQFFVRLEQAGSHLLSRFRPNPAETQRQDKFSIARCQIDLPSQSDVAVFCAGVFPGHSTVLREVLPAVRVTHEADRHFLPRCRAAKGQRGSVALREQHGFALVIAAPAGIVSATIR